VQLLEPLGDVTIVSVATAGPTLRLILPEQQAASLQIGARLPISFDATKLHLFRGHDGSAIRR
jgi:multiple sugar transport system ATP-binding protein